MNWVKNRWLDSLYKFLAFYAIFHIVTMIIGFATGSNVMGMGLNNLWSGQNAILYYVITLAACIVVYFVIFLTMSRDSEY